MTRASRTPAAISLPSTSTRATSTPFTTTCAPARPESLTGDRFRGTGAISAQDVILGNDAILNFAVGFACTNAASCNDNNPCTADACVDAVCVRSNAPNGTACNDGNACTQTDTCQAGACTGANPVVCTRARSVPRRGHLQPGRRASARTRPRPTARRATTATPARRPTPARPAPAPARTRWCARRSDQCHDAGTCNPAHGHVLEPDKRRTAPPATTATPARRPTPARRARARARTRSICAARDQCHDAGTCNPANGHLLEPDQGRTAPRATTATPARRPTPARRARAAAANPVVCAAQRSVPRRRHLQPGDGHLLATRTRPTAPRATTATRARRPTPARPARARARNPVVCARERSVPRRGHVQPDDRALLEPERSRTAPPATTATPAPRRTPARAGPAPGARRSSPNTRPLFRSPSRSRRGRTATCGSSPPRRCRASAPSRASCPRAARSRPS